MSDLREKQPDCRIIDMSKDTYGNSPWVAEIEVCPYFSIKNEDVYSRNVTLLFRANDIRQAHGFAQSIVTALSLVHDVYQANLRRVGHG